MKATIDRLSIEPTRACTKACSFCYNGSNRLGEDGFTAQELLTLVHDCARHGVRFVSLGGGDPLEWPPLFDVLDGLAGVVARSFTTSGLAFERDATLFDRVARARVDKVHVSVHAPESSAEVQRVVRQVLTLRARGVDTGVNLLVRRSRLAEARACAVVLRAAGIGNDRIMYLPARGIGDEPTPRELATVATGDAREPFQSMSCLGGCAKSERFASIAADRTVAWCSYTTTRAPLADLTHAALVAALPAGLRSCAEGLVRDVVRPRAT